MNNIQINNPYSNERIMTELATVNPLDNNPFKILLGYDDLFICIAENAIGEPISSESLIDINGEITLTANGKVIRMDSLKLANIGADDKTQVNIDGQVKTHKFTFKRHLYYTAVIYVSYLTQ